MIPLLLASLACTPSAETGETSGYSHTGDTGPPDRAEWVEEAVFTGDVGTQLRMVADGDELLAAAFSNTPWADGVCEEVPTDPPPRMRYDLVFARRAAGAWAQEVVDSPVVAFNPTGVDLLLSPAGEPVMAWTGGDPQMQYCGANEAWMGTRGTSAWTTEAAATTSGQSTTGLPASDAGFVVGLWPAAAFDADGQPAVLHRDTHFGSMQHDDQFRADAEFASRAGGSWSTHEAVDASQGAGEYGELIYDAQGRAVAIYAITVEAARTSRHGVWASRREAGGWSAPVLLHTGGIHHEIRAVEDGDGGLWVAFYSAADLSPKLVHLADPEQFSDGGAWTSERLGRGQYDEGRYVDLALDPAGRPALAWHRCRRADSGSGGCDPDDEAVIYAYSDGEDWHRETVREAESGSCGEYASLAFDAAGTAWVAYRCTVHEDEAFQFRTFASQRVAP